MGKNVKVTLMVVGLVIGCPAVLGIGLAVLAKIIAAIACAGDVRHLIGMAGGMGLLIGGCLGILLSAMVVDKHYKL